ncbi:YCII-related domain protein [Botrimarina colliarenosi]|uniref:YCII-related domain protein n=1 Tax=Botrimarina colliarenosi TaxID=2528001 RepID=A0A5C6AC67_9BACT|nr:YciI family protein [Botrimarina colliarenosi]TWT96987.1 YCII-related domain protein [Botrimarina colliarenosi]
MKYMLLIYGEENAWTDQERQECMLESMEISDELAAEGKWIASSPLHPVATATCVRVRDQRREITDGPFAETTEQLGGYYLIDVADLDEAIAIAQRLPPAKKGTVEIRPLFPLPDRDFEPATATGSSEDEASPET